MTDSDGTAARSRVREAVAQTLESTTGYATDATTTRSMVREAVTSAMRGEGKEPAFETCAIFVHAGAGFHSVPNESAHLMACTDACVAAMASLRNGMTAVDAVELAIKVLEDREITNAGYGSNLAIDGVVECDACVVDHLGHSGAVGAIAQVKNPIHVARTLLDRSKKTLLLRRVPPTLLVGQGATDFAYINGIPILPHDALIAPAARERWLRWMRDLETAKRRQQKQLQAGNVTTEHLHLTLASSTPSRSLPSHLQQSPQSQQGNPGSQTPQSVEPLSPQATNRSQPLQALSSPGALSVNERQNSSPRSRVMSDLMLGLSGPTGSLSTSPAPASPGTDALGLSDNDTSPPPPRGFRLPGPHSMNRGVRHDGSASDDEPITGDEKTVSDTSRSSVSRSWIMPQHPDHMYESLANNNGHHQRTPSDRKPSPASLVTDEHLLTEPSANPGSRNDDDMIVDTVGAIAIDSHGRISCAASSGGIGMKFRGRVGPAALLGVGAAIVPVDALDGDKTSVATVTSGTGEHMSSTLAAASAADRLYYCLKKKLDVVGVEAADAHEVLPHYIDREFMLHPSVRDSESTGAIGILGVQKTQHDIEVFYAHNTDSMAMAYMTDDMPQPSCTMSRTRGNGSTASGGKHFTVRRRRRSSFRNSTGA